MLAGADPLSPDRAVSNRYEEEEVIGTDGYGAKRTRKVFRDGIYDQARRISPKLRGESDTALGRYLSQQGCKGGGDDCWVRRRRGWQFPPLVECRQRWLERFPGTVWRDPETTEWTTEGDE